MRRPALVFTACVAIAIVTAAATAGAQSIEQQLKDRLLGTGSNTNNINNTNLNERDASSGVKEALAQGVDRAIRQLGKPDGFFRDQAVKILVPEKIRKLADLARQFGAGNKVDAFELSMNRAAEKAVPAAANILADSVRKMTLQDAIGLVRGGETSATDFFRRTSEQKLYDAFMPIVAKQTAEAGVTKKYKDFSRKAGGNALAGALLGGGQGGANSADLDDYVAREAIDGLFHVIAEQEKQIRNNPAARTTDLLRRVFRRN